MESASLSSMDATGLQLFLSLKLYVLDTCHECGHLTLGFGANAKCFCNGKSNTTQTRQTLEMHVYRVASSETGFLSRNFVSVKCHFDILLFLLGMQVGMQNIPADLRLKTSSLVHVDVAKDQVCTLSQIHSSSALFSHVQSSCYTTHLRLVK